MEANNLARLNRLLVWFGKVTSAIFSANQLRPNRLTQKTIPLPIDIYVVVKPSSEDSCNS